jgi:hypothetical protein
MGATSIMADGLALGLHPRTNYSEKREKKTIYCTDYLNKLI